MAQVEQWMKDAAKAILHAGSWPDEWEQSDADEITDIIAAHAPSVAPPPRGEKRPIARPCSACGDGDTEMKYHDHFPPFADESGAPSVAEAPAPTLHFDKISEELVDGLKLRGIEYHEELAAEGTPWESVAEPEPQYFATFLEAYDFQIKLAESAPALSESEETLRNRFEKWISSFSDWDLINRMRIEKTVNSEGGIEYKMLNTQSSWVAFKAGALGKETQK